MSSLEWNEVGQVFDELAVKTPSERTSRLEEIRLHNPSLADELLSLLKAHDSADGFIENRVQKILNTMAPPITLDAGERLLHFEIVQMLGAGSSAQVYLAKDLELGRLVALKVTLSQNKEAKTLAHFSIDGIVQVYSEHVVERADTLLRVLCLQYIAGPTLAELQRELKLHKQSLSFIEVLEKFPQGRVALEPTALKWRAKLNSLALPEALVMLVIRVAEILCHAHHAGVLHLDIKPANILIDPFGRPYLSDFNVSAQTEHLLRGDVQGMGGTPHFMSPEQREFFERQDARSAAQLGPASDVYALGVVLKDLLKGIEFNDPALNKIIDWATESDKTLRAPTAQALEQELCAWLRRSLAEREMPALPPVMRWISRDPAAALVAVTVLSQVLASVINITYNRLQIVSALTEVQNKIFMDFVAVYNSFTYPITILVGVWLLGPLFGKVEPAKARRVALRVPLILFVLISLGWLPGAYLFPRVIDAVAGPLDATIYLQFGGSFGLAWLISMTTSLALSTFVLARALYPKYWDGRAEVAAQELRFLEGLSRALTLAAALIPMAGVLLVVALAQYATTDYRSFKIILMVLVGYGLMNVLLVQRLTQYVERTFKALKQPRSFD